MKKITYDKELSDREYEEIQQLRDGVCKLAQDYLAQNLKHINDSYPVSEQILKGYMSTPSYLKRMFDFNMCYSQEEIYSPTWEIYLIDCRYREKFDFFDKKAINGMHHLYHTEVPVLNNGLHGVRGYFYVLGNKCPNVWEYYEDFKNGKLHNLMKQYVNAIKAEHDKLIKDHRRKQRCIYLIMF